MPVRSLPSNPNLDHLKYQAKDLLKAHAARNSEAAQRLREFHPRFSRATDASKVALAWLVAALRRAGAVLLDCQFMTEHLASLGAVEISQKR